MFSNAFVFKLYYPVAYSQKLDLRKITIATIEKTQNWINNYPREILISERQKNCFKNSLHF